MTQPQHGDPLAPASRMAEFIDDIIFAASATSNSGWKQSAIRCRRRPAHRKCPGRIRVRETAEGIDWACSVCHDRGSVVHWQGSNADLSEFRPEPGEDCFEVEVDEHEYDEIKKSLVLNPDIERTIYGAIWSCHGVVLRASGAELETLADHLAFLSNHESKGHMRETFDAVLDRVETLLGRFSQSTS